MSCILHIETSTEACSVAVSEDGWNEFKVADLNGPQHAVQLGVFVDEALSFVDRNDGGHGLSQGEGWEGLSLEYAGAAVTWKHAGNASKDAFAVQVGGGSQCLH